MNDKKQKSEKLIEISKSDNNILKLIKKSSLSNDELKKLIKSKHEVTPQTIKQIRISYGRGHGKFGFASDPHIGGIYLTDKDVMKAYKIIKKEGCDFITNCGDHTDGFYAPHRMQQLWELKDIGFAQQINHVVELYNEAPVKIYGIDGNHDETYIRLAGAIVGDTLEERLGIDKFENLGNSEGDLIFDNIKIRLRHPKTGSAYALSYRGQKYADSLTGGQKPNIILTGHLHKFFHMEYRNILMVDVGTLCNQTRWQRDKELANHKGMGIIEFWYNKKGITKSKVEWIPFYD